jgi:hypothetical protein
MSRSFESCAPKDLLSDVLANMRAHGLIFALLAAGNDEAMLMRNYVMGVGYQ